MSAPLAVGDGTSLTRTLTALERIDETHAAKPVCGLCGQRVNTLDKFGLCSKVSNTHRIERKVGAA
ncbi:MAG: hypothetical protein ABI067_17845 [Leifsonia sp.]